ncbi:MAG: phosphatase PAP2 family protein [Bryobacteraceae bacterium]
MRVRAAAVAAGLAVSGTIVHSLLRGQPIGFDLPVRAAIHGYAFPALTAAMRLVTLLGSEYFLLPLAAILVWRWVKRGERQAAYRLAAGSLGAEAVAQLLKALIHRPRPEVFFGLVPAETYSFPSGHAFVPAVFFWIVADALAVGARWRAAVVAMAAVLGFSRVYLGYHYPSDVVAGWALAVVWLAFWTTIADRHGG